MRRKQWNVNEKFCYFLELNKQNSRTLLTCKQKRKPNQSIKGHRAQTWKVVSSAWLIPVQFYDCGWQTRRLQQADSRAIREGPQSFTKPKTQYQISTIFPFRFTNHRTIISYPGCSFICLLTFAELNKSEGWLHSFLSAPIHNRWGLFSDNPWRQNLTAWEFNSFR